MDFFNDISRKFSNVARSVSEKTKESVESTRLMSDIRNARTELGLLYAEYGRMCYEIRMGAGDAEAADEAAEKIGRLINKIEDLSAQRDELRSVRRCAACGSAQAKDAKFCSNCGYRMPEEAPRPAAPEATPEAEYCPECGALRETGKRFCTVCGKDFEAKTEAEVVEVKVVRPAAVVQPDAEEPEMHETAGE